MKNTYERMKRCDEELAKGNNDLLSVRRLLDEAFGNPIQVPQGEGQYYITARPEQTGGTP